MQVQASQEETQSALHTNWLLRLRWLQTIQVKRCSKGADLLKCSRGSMSACHWERKVTGPLQNAVSFVWVEELCGCWPVVLLVIITHSLIFSPDWSDASTSCVILNSSAMLLIFGREQFISQNMRFFFHWNLYCFVHSSQILLLLLFKSNTLSLLLVPASELSVTVAMLPCQVP